MYRDSEMVIWFSSGRGLVALPRPLCGFAWPILLLIAMLALVGWPWANSQTQGMRQQYEAAATSSASRPANSASPPAATARVLHRQGRADSATANNVFISSIERNRQSSHPRAAAGWRTSTAKRFLLLSNGQRLERPLDTGGIKISEFETYGAKVGEQPRATSPDAAPVRTRTTLTLLRDPTLVNRGELAWRIGMLFGRGQLRAAGVDAVERESARRAAAATCCSRCSPSSSTTTCSIWARTGWARAYSMGGVHAGAAWRRAASSACSGWRNDISTGACRRAAPEPATTPHA